MSKNEQNINHFVDEINDMANSLKESVSDAESLTAKWNAVDKFMIDMERMQQKQAMTSRKSFKLTGEVEGNTGYLQGLARMPIMVNSIICENGELKPSEVAEMHIGTVDGRVTLLITPVKIG